MKHPSQIQGDLPCVGLLPELTRALCLQLWKGAHPTQETSSIEKTHNVKSKHFWFPPSATTQALSKCFFWDRAMWSSWRTNQVQAILDLPFLQFSHPESTGRTPCLQQLVPLAWVPIFLQTDFGAGPGLCTSGTQYLHNSPAVAVHCGISVLPLWHSKSGSGNKRQTPHAGFCWLSTKEFTDSQRRPWTAEPVSPWKFKTTLPLLLTMYLR